MRSWTRRLRLDDVRMFPDVTETQVQILAIVTKAEAQAWLDEEGTREGGTPGGRARAPPTPVEDAYCARMAKKTSAKPPARGRLESLRVSSGVREFVLDQLSGLSGIRDRAMFGGVGLYADDVFFGILASDVLYFKVDDSSRRDYERAGAGPFKPYADRAMTMSYYAVPLVVVEDATTLVKWAKRAVDVAMASKKSARKPSKKR
jgi:DNA transformation protein